MTFHLMPFEAVAKLHTRIMSCCLSQLDGNGPPAVGLESSSSASALLARLRPRPAVEATLLACLQQMERHGGALSQVSGFLGLCCVILKPL